MRKLLLLTMFVACAVSVAEAKKKPSYEWDQYPVPVKVEKGQKWVLQPHSDEFNYKADRNNKGAEFESRWVDYYHSNWSGPAPTLWCRDHVWVADGNLKIIATRPKENVKTKMVSSGKEKVEMPCTYTGCISSKKLVTYPVYVEARAKLSNSTMASDVWMLSPDATQEIDIIEAYGSDRVKGYGPDRLHLSHHVFIRKPFQDYQPRDPKTWYKDDKGTIWREDYHRVGVYWRDPFHLEYYVDGELVRTVSGKDIIDPKGFTEGTGLTKGLNIIINMEDQSWRAIKGLSPTDEELENEENCTFNVDWIRVYKLK